MRNDLVYILAGLAIGAVAGLAIGLLMGAVSPTFSSMWFWMAALCSYLGMVLGDRRRNAVRRAAAAAARSGTTVRPNVLSQRPAAARPAATPSSSRSSRRGRTGRPGTRS